ncbi:MAG: chromosomal replication initiator protein DnaA [Candidatus Peregrinibacteria bacterium]
MTDLRAVWEAVLRELATRVPRSQLLTWCQKSAILHIPEGVITIGIQSDFYRGWFEKHKTLILELIQDVLEDAREIHFLIDEEVANGKNLGIVDIPKLIKSLGPEEDEERKVKVRKLPNKYEEKIEGEFISRIADARFTLRNFVVGEDNQLAFAACRAVADEPGGAYNPLFIYGSVGLGKTHLLQATANEIRRKNSEMVVIYLTTENFIAEVVDAIQKRKMEKVRQKYRKVDVFILDDIQFLAGKDRTQEVFFHLFNDLYAAKKQVILSSDRPPLELELTEDRLKSRFSMGMIADMKLPDFETRLAISKIKAQEMGIMLDEDLLNFIAFNVHHSIRELEGVMLQTKAQIELQNITPTTKSVAKILKELNKGQKILGYSEEEKSTSGLARTMEEVVEGVSDYYQVPKSEVIGAVRNREFVVPRQIAMYLVKKYLKLSLQAIGEFFTGRDHTSVMHAIKKVEQAKKDDPNLWRDVNTIAKELGL